MPPPWCSPEKGGNGTVIGEILFGTQSFRLSSSDQNELNKLVDVLATFQYGQVHDFEKPSLLFLGDAEPNEGAQLGKERAFAVEQYIRAKLPALALPNMKFESAAKGGATLPGMKPAPGQARTRLVQITNKGKPITRLAAPPKKASSLAEALKVAQEVFNTKPPDHPNVAARIKHWIDGTGKASIERGDDAYINPADPTVINQAGETSRELSAGEMNNLKNQLPRIGPQLMTIAAPGNPPDDIRAMLISIDTGIMAGVDFLIQKKNMEQSTKGSKGLEQLSQYVSVRGNDPSSFYAAYGFGGVKQVAETDTAMGVWLVKADKWTWRYELRLDGRAKWTDVVNGKTGTGKWFFDGSEMKFNWDSSENKEIWRPLPLTPTGQKGVWTWKDGTSFPIVAVRERKIF